MAGEGMPWTALAAALPAALSRSSSVVSPTASMSSPLPPDCLLVQMAFPTVFEPGINCCTDPDRRYLECDAENRNIIELTLNSNDLPVGPIPASLGNLAFLNRLDINAEFDGPIPDSFRNLHSLRYLGITYTPLTGVLPDWLGDLTNLTTLGIYSTNITGPIPSSLGRLINLTGLYLWGNKLTGPIPPSLGDLVNLTSLDLDRNQLSGPIPPSLGMLENLEQLQVAACLLVCLTDWLT
ncbi:hypothetical protein BC831DRAFT_458660, partial [Entophlyctis helioformis]